MLDLENVTDWSNQLIERMNGNDDKEQWTSWTDKQQLDVTENKLQARIWKQDFALDYDDSIKKITKSDKPQNVLAAGYIRRMMEIRRNSAKVLSKKRIHSLTIPHEKDSEWSLQKVLVVIMINPSGSDDATPDPTTSLLYNHLPAEYGRLIVLNVTPVIATDIENLNQLSTQSAIIEHRDGLSEEMTDNQFAYINYINHYRVKPWDFEPDGKIELPKLFVDNSEARKNAQKIESENRELIKHVIHTLGDYQESGSALRHQQPFDILLATGNPKNKKSCGSILPAEYNKMISCLRSAIKDVTTVRFHPQVKRIVTDENQPHFTPFETSADASSKFGAHPQFKKFLDPSEDVPQDGFFYRLESYQEEQ